MGCGELEGACHTDSGTQVSRAPVAKMLALRRAGVQLASLPSSSLLRTPGSPSVFPRLLLAVPGGLPTRLVTAEPHQQI
jgi:hypothetical protein